MKIYGIFLNFQKNMKYFSKMLPFIFWFYGAGYKLDFKILTTYRRNLKILKICKIIGEGLMLMHETDNRLTVTVC